MTRSHLIQGKGSQYLNKLNTERSIHLVQNSNEGMIYLNPYAKDGKEWLGAEAYQFVLNPKVAMAGWKQGLMPPYPWLIAWGTSHKFSSTFYREKGLTTSLNFSSVFLPHTGITHD